MKHKKRNIAVIGVSILLLLSVIFFKVDYDRVSQGEKPIFAIEVWRGGSSSYKDYIGLFYQFTEEFYDTPTKPIYGSPSITTGPWFIPFHEVYSYLWGD